MSRGQLTLVETHYDNDSYRNHMKTAKEHTMNVAMVFVKRIMLDVDNQEDLELLLVPTNPVFGDARMDIQKCHF